MTLVSVGVVHSAGKNIWTWVSSPEGHKVHVDIAILIVRLLDFSSETDNTEDDYSQTMHPMARQPHREDDSFESLLRKLKEKLQDTKE